MLKIENKNLKNSFKKYFRIIKRKIEKKIKINSKKINFIKKFEFENI